MASITLHKYSPNSNNKENELLNGKRTEIIKSNKTVTNLDWAKQKAIDDQRKLRLTQVRQQSKEIASQIRENVRCEEKRQLDKVNKLKEKELQNWRQKQIGQIDKNYKTCLEHVGDAHLAAERENEMQRKFDEQKEKNRKLAQRRGKLAAQQLKGTTNMATTTINDKKSKIVPNIQSTTSFSDSDTSTSSTISSESSVCSVVLAKPKNSSANLKSKVSPAKIKSKVSPTKFKSNTLPKKSPAKVKWSSKSPEYDPTKFASFNSSSATDISLMDSLINDSPPVITKVSEMLRKSDPLNPRIAKTYKLSNSPSKQSQSISKLARKPLKPEVKTKLTTISSHINKTPSKRSKSCERSSTISERKPYVPEFIKIKDSNLGSAMPKMHPSNALRQKVQFYDHSNRFSKEYDGTMDLEQKEQEIIPPNAWQEAAKEISRQRIMNRPITDLRKLEENRAQLALERDRIRKEYDSMSKDLHTMLKDKSLSKSLRQNGETLSESRLLSDSLQGSRYECDSSFLLNFVTERTNKICDDIDQCRKETNKKSSQLKIEALHGLLGKVNTLRRILFEELKQSNDSRIDTNEILNEISKVEEERNDIMTDSPILKNQQREQTLSERERILKMKENCIDKKVHELYLREKEIEQQKKLAKITSGKKMMVAKPIPKTEKDGVSGENPVQIVINVNKRGIDNQGQTDVIVKDVKWGERLKKTLPSGQSIEINPIINQEHIDPKVSVTKTVDRKQLENASQSTSVTAYFSPPEFIETQLTKALKQQSLVTEATKQITDKNKSQNDKELLHYIVRLLGMSRTSVEQLNLSSISTVRTPNSSIVNVSSNRKLTVSTTSTPVSFSSSCSMERTESIDRNKLHQLVRFLAANRNLMEQKDTDQTSYEIWNDILSKDNSTKQNTKASKVDSTSVNEVKNKKRDELSTDSTKRIINLDTMISKEHAENTSADSLNTHTQKENVTEYLDLPVMQSNQNVQQINDDHSKSTNAPSSDFSSTSGTAVDIPHENRKNLSATRNKEIGESKDSGVGISRPVTSSDFRESPDLRQNTKASDTEINKGLLYFALRESKQDEQYEPFLKDIPKISYRIGSEGSTSQVDLSPEFDNKVNREKTAKPPAALNRYSPHMEDDLPHELSTITEIDTPATSRLNATDEAIARHSLKTVPDDEIVKFLYNQFPNFRDYIRSNGNLTHLSTGSVNESIEVTTGASVILGEKLEKLLDINNQAEALKYQQFKNDWMNCTEPNLAYVKFPSHSQYAETANGLLDSQSIDANLPDDTSLPDVLSELKARNIIDHSFEENSDKDGSFKDLFIIPVNKRKREQTGEFKSDSASETLEQELDSIGLSWASAMLRKSKGITTTSSSSSDSMNHAVKSRRSPQNSPRKIKQTKKTATVPPLNFKSNDNQSFVDENIRLKESDVEKSNASLQQTIDNQMKSMNLKEFLARELTKHSSMSSLSSSSNSSLPSIFLKSYLKETNNGSKHSGTPTNRGTDKHRTSTPVQTSSESKIDSNVKSSTVNRNLSGEDAIETTATNDLSKFFSGESHISSVGIGAADSVSTSNSSNERH